MKAPRCAIVGAVEHRLFVYGSLKQGLMHHDELRGARFVGRARTAPGWELVRVGEYPALVACSSPSRVSGELYVVDDGLLKRLDEFEDVPELYQRAQIELDGGSRVWGYTMTAEVVEGCARIPGGEWVR